MTRAEFMGVLAYISAGCGVPIADVTAEVYWDILSDLPLPALQDAAKKALVEHRYHTFPPVGLIRELALQSLGVENLSAGEAWQMAWKAAGDLDPEIRGPYRVYTGGGTYTEYANQIEAYLNRLPVLVVRAMRAYGIAELARAEKVDVARAHFMKIYSEIASREERAALLPPSVKDKVIQQTTQRIGQVPT